MIGLTTAVFPPGRVSPRESSFQSDLGPTQERDTLDISKLQWMAGLLIGRLAFRFNAVASRCRGTNAPSIVLSRWASRSMLSRQGRCRNLYQDRRHWLMKSMKSSSMQSALKFNVIASASSGLPVSVTSCVSSGCAAESRVWLHRHLRLRPSTWSPTFPQRKELLPG